MFSLPNRLLHGLPFPAPRLNVAPTDLPRHGVEAPERTLLDLVMPEYHFRGIVKVSVNATPEEVLRAVEAVALGDMPLPPAIGLSRYLPGRVPGRQRSPDDRLTRPYFEVAMPLRLGEDPGREIIIGLVGQFHHLRDQRFVDLPDLFTFTRFNDAAYQKLAMSFRVVPEPDGLRTLLVSDHRTLALSGASRRKFAVYWYLMARWGGHFMLRQLLNTVKRRAEADHRA